MDKNTLKSQWSQLKADVQDQWNDFTSEEVDEINGEWNQLVSKLQEKYNYSRIEAEEEVRNFMADFDDEDVALEEDLF
jgi:uncharacterized protein YjbJ (UPF0337 family)